MTTKTERIREILVERYPCQAIPQGDLTTIAREVGCTRELVRQVANRVGWDGRLYSTAPWGKGAPPRQCHNCGSTEGLGPKRRLCDTCREIPATCLGCGKPFIITRDRLREANAQSARRKRAPGYCSHACWMRSPERIAVSRQPRPSMQKPRVTLTCAWCGEAFTVVHARASVARYCSNRCGTTAAWRDGRIKGRWAQ